jgi:uncharacterized protein
MTWIKRQVERLVDTPVGEARLVYHRPRSTKASLLLGHGAGGGIDAIDLMALAYALPAYDFAVIRVEQPWVREGKKVSPAPATLDTAWTAVADSLRTRTPIVFGGRSAGARVACRTARRLGAVGAVALAFPLHPPGKPEKSRTDELTGAGVPTLVVQGERDPFGRPDEFPAGLNLVSVPGAAHSFEVGRGAPLSQEDALVVMVEAVVDWMTRLIG